MRYQIVDMSTNQNVKLDDLPSKTHLPANHKALYLPRLRCHDCPGKLYNPGPGLSVENFEIHLKNRTHRLNVEKRVARSES